MTSGPARRAVRAAALVASVLATVAQAAAHWAATQWTAAPVSTHAGHAPHGAGTTMLLAHALAAVLTGAVLARRGAALRRLAGLVDALLPALPSATALPSAEVAAAPAPHQQSAPVGRVLATARRRRGPPARTPLRPVAACLSS